GQEIWRLKRREVSVHKYKGLLRKKRTRSLSGDKLQIFLLTRHFANARAAVRCYLFSCSSKYFSNVVGSFIKLFGCSGTVLLSITACVISERLFAVFSVNPTDKSVSFHLSLGIGWAVTFLLNIFENVFATSSELYFCPVNS